MSWSV